MFNRKSYMFLELIILLTIIATACSESNITDTDAQIYLSKFGYLPPAFGSNSTHARLLDENTYIKAIEDFQKFAGLNETGELDEETKKVMSLPRCGVRDKVFHTGNRSKRYVLQGSRWTIKHLTYKMLSYPDNLRVSDVDAEIAKAFAVWSEHTDLTFTKSTGKAHIKIQFVRGEHGDGDPFDGRGGTLAHAFFPVFGGGVHFDADELWTINVINGTNLFQAAAHEFGHALGLSHSNIESALMAPFYRGYNPNFKLHYDDIMGIQYLYGYKSSQSTSSLFPSSTTPKYFVDLTTVQPNTDVCEDPKIDAIFRSREGQTYIFMGEKYYELSEKLRAHGDPKLISEGWPGLPGNIDASFTHIDGKTYFFKGTQFWRYNGRQLDNGYPKKINEVFKGIPDNLDAAMVWGNAGVVYFFKGNKFYYSLDPTKSQSIESGYTKHISNWKGLPINLDAAIQHKDGNTYFFKDNKFYKFYDNIRPFSDAQKKGYPYYTALWLFGCF